MAEKKQHQKREELYDTILSLSSNQECIDFFRDLCTVKELEALEQRYEVARMLEMDNVYLDIMQKTGASSATISRVKRMLSDGTGVLGKKIRAALSEEKIS